MTETLVRAGAADGGLPEGGVPASGQTPLRLRSTRSGPDRAFRLLLTACGVIIFALIVGVAGFLIGHALPALRATGLGFLASDHWRPESSDPQYGILGVLVGSLTIALIALVIAIPVSLATALVINEYAPQKLRRPLTAVVDLLASLPSLVYGLWGVLVFSNYVHGLTIWLSQHADFIPLFRTPQNQFGNSIFIAGLVVSIMIIPIVTSISREIMGQVPRGQCEAALALGGTRWGMVTDVIFPFARNGIVGSALLGLGRAIGETIAVTLILSTNNELNSRILEPGGGSISALITDNFTTAAAGQQSALTLAGLTLFALTLLINVIARLIVSRSAVPSS